MDREQIVEIFNEERASSYDDQLTNLEAMHDALMLGIRVVLGKLPEEARILCVGAGTGTEIVALAAHFPKWHFTAVEPAPAMLAKCREKLEAVGLGDRCSFHEGYLETLPEAVPFDAATCLLVSHFMPVEAERQAFYAQIGARLKPGGILINTDLTATDEPQGQDALMDAWVAFIRVSGIELERAQYEQNVQQHVGLLPVAGVERLLSAAGFAAPAQFFRMMMISGWFSRWHG